jgi:TolA-binding protein
LINAMLKRIKFIFFFSIISFTQIILVQSEELDVDQLLQKLDSIESRIKVLEKATFSKTTSDTGNNVSLDDYQSIITKQSIQIAELQNEVQSLTAKIEEMIFTMQSTVNNFNTFREDTEFRFIDINSKTESIEKNQLSMTLPNNETQNNNLVASTSGEVNLEPQSLGTINVSSEEELSDSPFEIKNVDEDKSKKL